MTPLQIKMMLHYHCVNAPYSEGDYTHANSPAVREQRQWLEDEELLRPVTSPSGWGLTDRGRAYVKALCEMGLPVAKWVIPEREEAA